MSFQILQNIVINGPPRTYPEWKKGGNSHIVKKEENTSIQPAFRGRKYSIQSFFPGGGAVIYPFYRGKQKEMVLSNTGRIIIIDMSFNDALHLIRKSIDFLIYVLFVRISVHPRVSNPERAQIRVNNNTYLSQIEMKFGLCWFKE